MLNIELVILAGTFVGFLTTVLGAFIVVWREINGVHKLVNSRMDELLALTRKSSLAEGYKEGMDRPSGRTT